MNAEAMTSRQGDVDFQRQLYEDANYTRRGLHRARRDWVLEKALGSSKRGDRVLEVGVGCGIFTEALSGEGRKVSAVDINPAFLDNVSGLKSVDVYQRDATKPLELGHHDLAAYLASHGFIAATLEHPKDNFIDDSGDGRPVVMIG